VEIKARIQGNVIYLFTVTYKALFGVFYAINRTSEKKFFKKMKKSAFFYQHFNDLLRHYFKLRCLAEVFLANPE
jgi:hypothetical protein